MKKALLTIWSLLLLLCLTGCMEDAMIITVNPDGSGELMLRHAMNEAAIDGMAGGLGFGEEPAEAPDVTKQLKEKVLGIGEELGDAVKLKSEQAFKTDKGWAGFQAVYTFADINKLELHQSNMGVGENVEDVEVEDVPDEEKLRFKFEGKRLEVLLPALNAGDDAPAADDPESQAMMAMMAPMLKGMRLMWAVKLNGPVKSNTADLPFGGGKGFLLMDLKMDKLVGSPALMKKVEEWEKNGAKEPLNFPSIKAQSTKPLIVEFE